MSNVFRFQSDIELQAGSPQGKPQRVRILAYSGGTMRVSGWGAVAIDLAGLETPARLPILVDHDATTGGVAGSGEPQSNGRELTIAGSLASTPAGEKVASLLRDGVPLQASVGVEPTTTQRLRAGEKISVNGREIEAGNEGLTLVKAGRLREVSVLPVGADANTQVSLAARKSDMDQDKTNQGHDAPGRSEPADLIQAERERFRLLVAACGTDTATLQQALDNNWTPEQAGEVARMRASRPVLPSAGINAGMASTDTRTMLAAATLRLLGQSELAAKEFGDRAASAADSLHAGSFVDLCRAACRLSMGYEPTDRSEMIRAAFSSTDLSTALGVAADKIALDAYRQAPATWRSFCRVVSAGSFRQHTGIRLAAAVQLDEVADAGEIKHGKLSEEILTYQVATYGKLLALTRKQIINDDLGLFQEIPQAFGRAAVRKLADLVYTVLMANAGSFFSANNGNLLTGADSALSIESLADALKALRNQTDSDGMPLDLQPKVLLVPPSLEATGRQILNSVELARTGADNLPIGNPFAGMNLTLEVEPRLENSNFTGHSETAWYLLCGPADGPFLTAFLNGRQGPVVEQAESDFSTLGLQWRVYIDAGASQGDHRAAVKAAGE